MKTLFPSNILPLLSASHRALAPFRTIRTMSASANGLEREFKFKTFKKTWAFMDAVAAEAARVRHHPEWSNVYNTTFIRWTTHHPPGLSALDVQMAAFCDAQATAFGVEQAAADKEQPAEPPTATDADSSLCGLANRAAQAGGECCVPPSARAESGAAKEAQEENLHAKGP